MNIGDIVRVSEESMHWELFQQFDMPPEGILLTIDEDMEDEKYLVEFVREEHFLHDGGQMDDLECRYWIDKIDLLEECIIEREEAWFGPQPAQQPAQEPRAVFIDDVPPDIDFNNEIMRRYARHAARHAADAGLERPEIRTYWVDNNF